MAKYRAIRACYGFRGQFWELGDVAEDVTKAEAERADVQAHFTLIKAGESDEVPPHRSLEPRETTTLSEIQENSSKSESVTPKPGPKGSRK